MLRILQLSDPADAARVETLLGALRLDAADLALSRGGRASAASAVQAILADVAARGDDAVVDSARCFDDPDFTADQIRVTPEEMADAVKRISSDQLEALRRSIRQVREYQSHVMPRDPEALRRPGVELGLRFTPLASAGCYFPGGHAAYPSTLIMLAVPAQVAGVKRVVACTPPSRFGRSDLVLAACHELKLTEVFRAGGVAAIAAMAFGTKTIPAVDKIVGPGNLYVQLAKRAVAGGVAIDGFLGPSEILTLADDSANARFVAADLMAQAEHDPGSCYLLTTSGVLARRVVEEVQRQMGVADRSAAIDKAMTEYSAIIVDESIDKLIDLANRFAAEHVSLQVADEKGVLEKLVNAGAIFLGGYSPVAAGDYVAGPSHCLPTNTTARFASGISVYEFLKRSSVVRYTKQGLAADAPHIIALANAEHLGAHARSVDARLSNDQ